VPPEPQLESRPAQPYAGIRMRVTMDNLGAHLDAAFPELFGWLAQHGITPAGPPFVRFHVIDMDRELDIEVGAPADAQPGGDGRVGSGVLPAGRYLVLRHTGSYDGLIASNAALQAWAREHGVAFDCQDTPDGSAWVGRVEHYLTDPAAEPDPANWQTDIAYLTREP
jgi:effector-binding domain-containing protein